MMNSQAFSWIFFNTLTSKDEIEKLFEWENPNKLEFLNTCFQHGEEPLGQACTNQLLTDDTILLAFLRAHPDKAVLLQTHPQKIRKIWHDYMFTHSSDDFPLLASLVRNNLIPPSQIEEAFTHLIKKGIASVPNEIDNKTLVDNGFYQILEKILGEGHELGQFDWANTTKALVVKYLSDYHIAEQIARAIYSYYDAEYYPFQMAEYLNNLFATNKSKKKEYLNLIKKHDNIGIPKHIPELLKDS